MNPKARSVDEFVEAEKILGTIHIAFGDNAYMLGGQNPSKNHMDFLISKPTVNVVNEDCSGKYMLVNGAFNYN